MDKNTKKNASIIICGGNKAQGQVAIPGDKISAVHLLFASLISNEETWINNMHFCDDVMSIIDWAQENDIAKLGQSKSSLRLKRNTANFNMTSISKSRASICLVSASALKFGRTEIDSSIGGCCFTDRLIDRHIDLIHAFGISLSKAEGKFLAIRTKTNNTIDFDCSTKFGPSVGVTAHALIAALVFKGELTLRNVALEPVTEVLIDFLRKTTGRKVTLKNRVIKILSMKKISHFKAAISLPHDTTVALTYISMSIATEGSICLKGVKLLLPSVNKLLDKMNVKCNTAKEGLCVSVSKIIHPKLIECTPWPGIPSDVGPIVISGLCKHKGQTKLVDRIYNSRSTHVKGLNIMGYDLTANGQSIIVNGKYPNSRTVTVAAIDIRAGAALLIGASARLAKTNIIEAYQLFRGYQNIIEDMKSLNVDIKLGESQWTQKDTQERIVNGGIRAYL